MDARQALHEEIYARIEELPTLPAVIPRLLALLEDPRSDAAAVTGVIAHDPALTAKILKVANSAYYGFSRQIESLQHAVALLGFNMVKSLAISIGVIKSLPGGPPSEHFSAAGLWLHSLAVAVGMQELSRQLAGAADRDYLFIIGLLHDLGKVVLDQFFPELFRQVLAKVEQQEGARLHEIERQLIGIDHSEVGAMLLNRWRFPARIVAPVAALHRRPAGGVDPVDVALLRLANRLAQEIACGQDGNRVPNRLVVEDLEVVGLDEAALARVRERLQARREELEAFLAALG
ncbi:MAG: HDOD domain-containing protein [Deltaproteobacteria bacterium]|nr:HDOD domain-containing protein [Deltaproteobacteria bacterium]